MKRWVPRKAWMTLLIGVCSVLVQSPAGLTQPQATTAQASSGAASGGHGEWIWMSGASVSGQKGIYGTLGTAAPGNVPGARGDALSWTDAAGNFWLFGGEGFDSTGGYGWLNDLWKYSGGEWTWMGGSKLKSQRGKYGTEGAAAAGNVPGARGYSVGWTDAAGNLWLFGGYGSDSVGREDVLNDLWKYNAGKWTWMGGSNVIHQAGRYGTQGTPAAGNIPSTRKEAVRWTDAAGNIWLYGGDSTWEGGNLSDLWKYSAGKWTWVAGPDAISQNRSYGTKGEAAAGNHPGARSAAVGWIDAAGNLWLFGGRLFESSGKLSDINDLWKYSAGEWTWMGGSNTENQAGMYGSQGMAAASNAPGARESAVSWTDAEGNFWLFGGAGCDSACTAGKLNDLWKYSAGNWTWVGGSNVSNRRGTYGTKGTAAAENIPGGRYGAVGWTDANGNLWLFGGFGSDAAGKEEFLNDLWKYEP